MARLLAFGMMSLPALAQGESPVVFSKFFSPDTIGPGSTSRLQFDLNNDAGTPADDLAFVDTLPAGVVIASPAGATNTCGGLLSVAEGGTVISLSVGQLGAFSSCSIGVHVTSNSFGSHSNVSGNLTSSLGDSGTASATLNVFANRPGFFKSFNPSTIPLGGVSVLTVTIDNTANEVDLLDLSFTDNLPPGMVVATPANAATDCGNPQLPPTLTADPGTSVVSLSATGVPNLPVLTGGSSCTVTVDTTTDNTGVFDNVSGELTFSAGQGDLSSGFATDTLNVPVDFLVKSFTDDPTPPGGMVTLEFTVTNLDRVNSATNIAFTDDLDGALTDLAATDTPLTDICGTGSQLTGTSFLSFSGGQLGPGESCSFDVTLLVPAMASPGDYTNTTSPFTADIDGEPVERNAATDQLLVRAAPLLTKTFTDDPTPAGAPVTLEFTITNTSLTSDASNIAFTDNLTATLAGLTATGLPADGFCGVGSTLVQTTGPFGESILSMAGGSLAPGGSCTFSVTLTVPAEATNGIYPNTTSAVTATVDDIQVAGAPARDDLTVIAAPTLRKEFTDDPVPAGGTVTLEFTLIHSIGAPTAATGITFSDDLSSTLAGLTAVGLPLDNVCGTGSSITGTTNLALTGGVLQPGETCTFSVTLQVPDPAAPGSHTNTSSEVTATVLGTSVTSAAAADELIIAALLLTKSFTNDPVLPGATVNLQFTIENVASETASAISFSDDLDNTLSGLVATGLPQNDVCGTGSTLSGTSVISLTGGTLDPMQTCTFDVTLQVPPGAASDTYLNATTGFQATIGQSTIQLVNATDGLVVSDSVLQLTKSFTDDPVAPGGTVNLEFTLANLDADIGAFDIAFTDNLDAALAGLAATGLPQSDICGAGSVLTGTSTISLSGGVLGAGGSCTFSVPVSVPSNVPPGTPVINTTSPVTGANDNEVGISGDPATDNLQVRSVMFGKAFDGPTAAGGTPIITFTIQNLDSGNSVGGLAFTDNLGAVLGGLTATGLPANNVCGVGSQLVGTSTLGFSGGNLGPGASCTFDVALQVPLAAAPGSYINTTSALFSSGLQVSNPAGATLSVESPPAFSKSFAPAQVALGFSSTLTFTIDNTASAIAASGLDFTDNLPPGLVVAAGPGSATTCSGGTLTALPGSGVISYSGGLVGAGASCLVQANVTAVLAGIHVNTSAELTSSSGNSGPAGDTLTVVPQPGFSKSFAPDAILPGGVSSLTLVIDNTGSPVAATALDFTDNLPAGVTIATPGNAGTTCTGGTLTAPDGGSTISYTGGTVSAGAICTVSADVTGDMNGAHLNTTEDLTSSLGNSGTASDSLNVGLLGFAKDFTDDPVPPGATVTLEFTIESLDPASGASDLSFTDDLGAVLPGLAAVGLPASDVCGAGSQIAGTDVLTFTGGNLAPGGSCTFSVTLQIPVDATPGTYFNTTSVLSGLIGVTPGSVASNFRLQVAPAAAATAMLVVSAFEPSELGIPTLSEWGLFVLIAGLLLAGLWSLRRFRREESV